MASYEALSRYAKAAQDVERGVECCRGARAAARLAAVTKRPIVSGHSKKLCPTRPSKLCKPYVHLHPPLPGVWQGGLRYSRTFVAAAPSRLITKYPSFLRMLETHTPTFVRPVAPTRAHPLALGLTLVVAAVDGILIHSLQVAVGVPHISQCGAACKGARAQPRSCCFTYNVLASVHLTLNWSRDCVVSAQPIDSGWKPEAGRTFAHAVGQLSCFAGLAGRCGPAPVLLALGLGTWGGRIIMHIGAMQVGPQSNSSGARC